MVESNRRKFWALLLGGVTCPFSPNPGETRTVVSRFIQENIAVLSSVNYELD
jgi:hypothetical protein